MQRFHNQLLKMASRVIAILLLCVAGAAACVIPSERYYEEAHFSGEAVDLYSTCFRRSADQTQAPILLLHGLTLDRNSWSGIYEVLAMQTGREVCTVDARNHGNSPWSEEFSIALTVKDTIHLMDQKKMPKAIVLGHSMGGATAIQLALEHPERVEKLIVEDARVSPHNPEDNAMLNATVRLLLDALDAVPSGATSEEQAKQAVVNYVKKHITEISGNEASKDEIEQLEAVLECPSGKCRYKVNFRAARKALEDRNFMAHELEGSYDGGALFVYGELSGVGVDKDKEKILTLFSHAKFAEIKGVGHDIHTSKPKEFLEAVIWFIKENFIVS